MRSKSPPRPHFSLFKKTHNADGRVTSLIKKEDVQQAESAAVVDKTFDGSLPRFVAAFLNSKPISDAEAAEIRALLDAARYKEE